MDGDLESLSREALIAEVKTLRAGIRAHRDTSEHELCWHHPALWGLLPEREDPVPTVPEWPQFMRGCIRYRQSLDEQLPAAPRTTRESTEQDLFTRFWARETRTTRNVLARIPDGSAYRPDPKSRTAQEIAWQIVCEEAMIIQALETGTVSWNPPPMPASMADVLQAYDEQSATLPGRWAGLPAEKWTGDLDFLGSKRPASAMAWSFLFDIVHHRGQISTYLRPMGSTVPRIYGPSGDEP